MIIYKTTNVITGKFYIGKDSKNIKSYLGGGVLIKKSIKKYGKENFIKEILCECSSQEELNQKEIYWIEKLDATNLEIGYNLAKGGGSGRNGCKLSESHLKIIKSPKSEEFKQNLRNRFKNKNNHPSFGKTKSKETRQKISKTLTGRKLPKNRKTNHKQIIEYDMNMNFIREWPSIISASKEYNIDSSYIIKVCKLKKHSHNNKIFRYKE